ncbi:MAG: trypsin-like serine protease, partial [Myxococcota bacterium]|nr:trypsin-like serine protease [Myxococcota bacterium]
LVIGACGPVGAPGDQGPALQTAQLPIKGGYNSADTAVVGLGMASQGGFGTCSGTIISENVILTAQHCISDMSTHNYVDCNESTFGPSQDPFYVFVTNQSPMPWNPDAYIRCREVLVPEASNWACGYDIALLILEDPIPWNVEPMVPRVDTAPIVNDSYSAIGYGATNGAGGGSGTRRRRDDLVVTCGPGECPTWYPMEPSEWIGDEGVCQGDSGGPAVDAFGRIIGVASRGGGECSSPVYSGVSPWGEWIKDTVVYAAGLEGLDVPAWAMGWPTHPDYAHAIGGWCAGASDCDSGLCAGGICTRKCADVAPCPTGFYCSVSEVCELVPVGGRCAEATECLGGWCLDGTCSRTCSEEMACPDGFECDPVAVGCRPEIGAYCTDNTACVSEICLGELCTRECDADLDCPDGWNCTNGACLLDKVGMGCKDDLACPGGYCVDGICSRTCADNTPCPAGYRCDTAEGVCQLVPAGSACASNVDCNFSLCVDGICTRACSSEAPCPAGMHCDADSGQCAETPVGDTCEDDSACLSGLCVDGACTRSCDAAHPCLAGYGCDAEIC